MAQETAQQKAAREAAEKALGAAADKIGVPRDPFGSPMVKITAAAAELVPTVQFGNATIGPVMIERYVQDGPDDVVKGEIKRLQAMVEEAVAEDRETLHEQIRARAGQ
jgi:hypothetical protein